jgi:hypothetical protein
MRFGAFMRVGHVIRLGHPQNELAKLHQKQTVPSLRGSVNVSGAYQYRVIGLEIAEKIFALRKRFDVCTILFEGCFAIGVLLSRAQTGA